MDEQLVRALESISAEYKVVLLLWAVDELSYNEAGNEVTLVKLTGCAASATLQPALLSRS